MRRRILLADDSVTIQKVIELTFMDEDYDVKAVSNGDEALAALPELRPDVVIADVHMPGANGYEVCRRSKEIQPDVPVLLLVGTFEPFDEGQARAAGADSFLKKPFDSQELLQRVQDLIASRSGAAAAPAAVPAAPAVPDKGFGAALPPLDLGSFDPAPAFDTAAGFTPAAAFEPAPVFEPAAEETDWGSFQLEPEPAPTAPAAPRLDSPFLEEEASPFVLEDDRATTAFQPAAFPEAFPVDEAALLPAGEPMFELDSPELDSPELSAPPPSPSPSSYQPAGFAAPWETDAAAPAPAAAWSAPVEPEPEPLPWNPEPEPAPWSPEPAPWNPPPLEAEAMQPPPLPEAEPPAAEPPAAELMSAEPPVSAEPPAAAPLAVGKISAHSPAAGQEGNGHLSEEDVDRIARRVVELMGDKAIRDIAWEVIPDLAEVVIRTRLRELEAQVENPAE